MDSITHALSGVVMAKAGLAQRYGRGTTLFLVVAASLPDIDAALGLFVDDAYLYRRGFTHSVVGLPLLALGAAAVMRLFTKAIPFAALLAMGLAAMVVHVLLDLLNSYGVMVLFPFSTHRFELAWTFIIDLVFWVVLLAPLVLSWTGVKWLDVRRLSQGAIVTLVAYVLGTGAMHAYATHLLARTIDQEQLLPDFRYVFPEALGPHRFRGVVRQGTEYRMYLVNLPRGTVHLVKTYETELNDPAVQRARQTDRGQQLEWFFKAPVWRKVEPLSSETGAEVEVFDLRFASTVVRTDRLPFLKRVPAED